MLTVTSWWRNVGNLSRMIVRRSVNVINRSTASSSMTPLSARSALSANHTFHSLWISFITHAHSLIGVGRTFESVCMSVCLSVCPEHNSKTKDRKVFKLGIENDLGISYKRYGFGVEGWKVEVRVKPGFHYPSWRPKLTARVGGRPVSTSRVDRSCWRPVLTGNGNRSPSTRTVNSGRQLG